MRFLFSTAAIGLVMILGCERGSGPAYDRGAAPESRSDERTSERASDVLEQANATGRLLAMIRTVSEGEVELGKLAQERASSPAVKEYANKLVTEHQQDIDAVEKLAKNKNIPLDRAESDPFLRAKKSEHEEAQKQLSSLSGADFDKQFMMLQPGGHAMLSKLALEGERLSDDPEVDGFFKTISGQASDHKAKAIRVMPKECGGQGAMIDSGAPDEDKADEGAETNPPSTGQQGAGQQGAGQRGAGPTNQGNTGVGTPTTGAMPR